MATFRKRDGKWQAQVRCAGAALSKTFSSRADAVAWARLTEASLQRAASGLEASAAVRAPPPPVAAPPATPSPVTLFDLLERYEHVVTPTKRGHTAV